MGKRKVTLADIAQQAGVSAATVSMALNGKPGISGAVREKLITLAVQMGYPLPQRTPETLTEENRICLIDHIFPDQETAEQSMLSRQLLQAIRQTVEAQGYRLEVLYGEVPPSASEAFQGVLIVGGNGVSQYDERLQAYSQPVVMVGSGKASHQLNTVSYDNEGVIERIVQRLYAQGHRQIAMVQYETVTPPFRERWQGYRNAMEHLGLEVGPQISVVPYWDSGPAVPMEDIVHWLQADCQEVTAFVCATDLLAMATMNALRQCGRQPGQGIAVVGFDDTQYALISEPPLASVRLREEELGRQAVQRLITLIDDPNQPVLHLQLPLELIERESLCPALHCV